MVNHFLFFKKNNHKATALHRGHEEKAKEKGKIKA